jgi:hypothetical protein
LENFNRKNNREIEMKYTLKHNINPFYTHQPILYNMLMQTTGPILELGCGDGSTELIHLIGQKQNRKIITVESLPDWAIKYKSKYQNNTHSFIVTDNHSIESWNKVTDTLLNEKWGLVFIDQGFWEARAYSFAKLKDISEYIILHDCDYFGDNNLIGTSIEKFVNQHNRGKRDYSKDIKYWKEYFPNLFVGPTGPPTLLASEFHTCDIDIDFDKYDVTI